MSTSEAALVEALLETSKAMVAVAARSLDDLEQDLTLVHREDDQQDRRITRVSLTPAGHGLVDRVLQRRRDELGGVVRELGDVRAGKPVEVLRDVAEAIQRLSGDTDDWRL